MTNNTYPFYIVYHVLTFEGTSDKNFEDTTAGSSNFLLFIALAFTSADIIRTLRKMILKKGFFSRIFLFLIDSLHSNPPTHSALP